MIDESINKIEDQLKDETEKENRRRAQIVSRGENYEAMIGTDAWKRLDGFLQGEYIRAVKELKLEKLEMIESIYTELGQTISLADITRKQLDIKPREDEW